ncbi:hypothetical protein B0A48_13487 [Cryoendolithus antarcticus]|uniref:A to I editase domain-containing protein n=1 Tax=Cryoendolithus antarcticus TaxID=1507870 RepID=A0A1V8SP12_9PEZI|nr:hypothetical protein B0A48_13487 [Cryoendolithus antarcticus]
MPMRAPHPDAIADCVLAAFNKLSAKFKPRALANGGRESVPLAGIVLCRTTNNGFEASKAINGTNGDTHYEGRKSSSSLTCVSLATGMRCLPQSKLAQAKGNVLHDWHAEILAIRGFNRWVLEECLELAKAGKETQSGEWVAWRSPITLQARSEDAKDERVNDTKAATNTDTMTPPFTFCPEISIHMYVSQAPCGDASMELLMSRQPSSEPWTHAAPSADPDDMLGRGHFDQLGVVRRKPSRPDAPVTASKSCSDKLAFKQVTGLLSGLVGGLVGSEGSYLESVVLPEKEIVREAVERCWGKEGRIKDLVCMEERRGMRYRPFGVEATSRNFEYAAPDEGAVGSNLSALWTPRKSEVLINGVLQGRKQFDPKGASCVSRREMWKLAHEVAEACGARELCEVLHENTYGGAKRAMRGEREGVKDEVRRKALQGWRSNEGDEDWSLNDA